MKTLALTFSLLSCLFLVSFNADASPPTRIQFARGASGATWNGVIKDGNKKFKLNLARGQSLKVGGGDIYTWSVVAQNGDALGCDGGDYCVPDGEIPSLPYSGDYVISTDYRMSGCATCPSSRTRHVTVFFEAR